VFKANQAITAEEHAANGQRAFSEPERAAAAEVSEGFDHCVVWQSSTVEPGVGLTGES
jgi:hypothetical protein